MSSPPTFCLTHLDRPPPVQDEGGEGGMRCNMLGMAATLPLLVVLLPGLSAGEASLGNSAGFVASTVRPMHAHGAGSGDKQPLPREGGSWPCEGRVHIRFKQHSWSMNPWHARKDKAVVIVVLSCDSRQLSGDVPYRPPSPRFWRHPDASHILPAGLDPRTGLSWLACDDGGHDGVSALWLTGSACLV